MALTPKQIQYAKPAERDYKLFDSKGLFLIVSPAGGKSWRFKYRFGERERLLTLGKYPDIGLVAAREARDEAAKLLAQGKNPAVEKKKVKLQRRAASEATFRKLGDEWLGDMEPLWSPANYKRVKNRLERDLYPQFGTLPVGDIESGAILRALRRIEARGSIETAKRVRGYIQSVFRRAKGEGFVGHPIMMEIDEIKDALKPVRRGRRQPALTEIADIIEFQKCVDRSTSNLQTKLASRLLALTLVRVGVLRTAPWSEFTGIDWDDPDSAPDQPVWKIPASRMKLVVEDKDNPAFGHDVPLCHQAVEVLRTLRALTGSLPLVFPSAKGWRVPMSDAALSTMYKRMAGGRYQGQMVPHGWRASFSTIMNERAAELERDGDRIVIDMILAHVPEGISASEWSYNRSRYRRPRTALHQIWGDLISDGLAPVEKLLSQE
ncbi:tyrosine-type recombinase/integrase [Sphingobium yanoikuyae]|uniref:tyrosine-type recombinase/integrase n=1 Tax=Sphingobium yanoikuyae TaxID=13690 RepID=UPI00241D9BB0|nr:integrase arm-type DNA-binding domain-containing protein [Sphingobium yanoikuyae]